MMNARLTQSRFASFDSLARDVRFGARMIARQPGLLAVVVLTMALGIGVNTAVFGLVRSIVLRPLPVPQPDRIFFVTADDFEVHSIPNYVDLRDRNKTFLHLAAYRPTGMALDAPEGGMRQVWGTLATGNYFETLDVVPIRGRFFTPADESGPGSAPLVVLGHAFWNAAFRGDDNVVGSTIRINGLPYTVIGVAPPEFRGTDLFYPADLWVPMAMQEQVLGRMTLDVRNIRNNNRVFGRLRDGVTRDQAQADLDVVASGLSDEYPDINARLGFSIGEAGSEADHTRGAAAPMVLGISVLAGVVLIAACLNLASMLGTRVMQRVPEFAMRASLGATRARLLSQLLVEIGIVCAVGGVAGLATAALLLRLVAKLFVVPGVPLQFTVTLDLQTTAFAVMLCALTVTMAFLIPARHVWKSDPRILVTHTSTTASRTHSPRDLVLALQVAMCCVLVAGCLVSMRGLQRSLAVPLGFDPEGVTLATFDLSKASYTPEDGRAFQARVLEAVSALPGVTEAAYAHSLPLTMIDQSTRSVFPEGTADFGVSVAVQAQYFHVSPGYFRFMRTRLIGGREYTQFDGPGRRVAVINETFARQIVGAQDAAQAVGRTFRINAQAGPIEIVGVAEDGKYGTLAERPRPVLFLAALGAYNPLTTIAVRTTLTDQATLTQIRQLVREMDPRIPLQLEGRLTDAMGSAYFASKSAATALGAFGVLAVVIAVLGIYGVASGSIAARMKEIGIRMAIGASPVQVVTGILGRPFAAISAGAVVGIATSVGAGSRLVSVVANATTTEPLIIIGVGATMAAAAIAAAWMPARKALRLDPARTLREA